MDKHYFLEQWSDMDQKFLTAAAYHSWKPGFLKLAGPLVQSDTEWLETAILEAEADDDGISSTRQFGDKTRDQFRIRLAR